MSSVRLLAKNLRFTPLTRRSPTSLDPQCRTARFQQTFPPPAFVKKERILRGSAHFRAPDDHHGRDRSWMDARHRQGRAQRRQRADHGQHRPGTRTRPWRPTGRSRRFSRTLRQIRSAGPIFPRATDRARPASHPLTPIASRDPHAQAGPPPEKIITLASLMAPRMVRRHDASRRDRASRRIRVTSAAPRLPFRPLRESHIRRLSVCVSFAREKLFRAREGCGSRAITRALTLNPTPHDARATRHTGSPRRVHARRAFRARVARSAARAFGRQKSHVQG